MSEHVKRSALAGTWYAADAEPLRRQVDDLLDTVDGVVVPERLAGLVVPHAGYDYSGRAAAAGYARLRGVPFRRALILAPSHYAAFRGAVVLDVAYFETPLGRVPVDAGAVATLAGSALCRVDPAPFRDEHAVEIQLPFLQRVLPGLPVVPVLLGSLAGPDYARVADVLGTVVDAETLVIVSSDFVHYGSRFAYEPFPAHDAAQVRGALRRLDMGAIDLVCRGDAAGFAAYVAATGATICGAVPIGVFLTAHAGRTPGRLLIYYTSVDVTHDYAHTVSYAAVAFPAAGKGASTALH
jgi:MEMO1 family protein